MKQLSNQALAWLSLIFKERFGHSFTLKSVEDGISMTLVNQSKGEIIFPHTFPEFFQSRSDIPFTTWDAEAEGWDSVLNEPLPAPGIASLSTRLIEQDYVKSKKVYIKYDILGLTYWMLNRIEEIGRTDLDNHQRFPAINSHAYKYGYLDRPIVDEWLDVLKQVIQKIWLGIKVKKHEFSIKVSHDVDAPSRFTFLKPASIIRSIGALVIKNKNINLAIKALSIYLSNKKKLHPLDPWNTFDWLMEISEKNNLSSAFYFICGRTDKRKDALYELEDPAIQDLMIRIHQRGHEIGLHPSYNSFDNSEQIKFEAQKLKILSNNLGIKQSEWGGRMHYLRWSHPDTLQAWNDAGMDYESTLGYADLPGFRCGTCHEYTGFNSNTNVILNLKIRPLIVMDGTVIAKHYMNLGYTKKALEKILEYKKVCRKFNGNFTFLWHNSFFENKYSFELYKDIIEL